MTRNLLRLGATLREQDLSMSNFNQPKDVVSKTRAYGIGKK